LSVIGDKAGQPLTADVYLNVILLYEDVTQFEVTVPMKGSPEIRVVAPGYQPWAVVPQGKGSDKVMSRPVQLVPEE
jgi:hypothetical protein